MDSAAGDAGAARAAPGAAAGAAAMQDAQQGPFQRLLGFLSKDLRASMALEDSGEPPASASPAAARPGAAAAAAAAGAPGGAAAAGGGGAGEVCVDWGSLCRHLAEDAFAACCASLSMSPLVMLVDRAIVASTTGGGALSACLRRGLSAAARRPLALLRSQGFQVVFGVYAGTYMAANAAETISSAVGSTASLPKLACATLCNIFLCVRKDIIFAKLYGAPEGPLGASRRAVPAASVALFFARDGLTIASAFTVPPLIAASLESWAKEAKGHTQQDPQRQQQDQQQQQQQAAAAGEPCSRRAAAQGELRGGLLQPLLLWRPELALTAAQVLSPVSVQLLSTPLHLLSLDIYHRPKAPAWDRLKVVSSTYGPAVVARAARIIPAFGGGTLINGRIRSCLAGPQAAECSAPEAPL